MARNWLRRVKREHGLFWGTVDRDDSPTPIPKYYVEHKEKKEKLGRPKTIERPWEKRQKQTTDPVTVAPVEPEIIDNTPAILPEPEATQNRLKTVDSLLAEQQAILEYRETVDGKLAEGELEALARLKSLYEELEEEVSFWKEQSRSVGEPFKYVSELQAQKQRILMHILDYHRGGSPTKAQGSKNNNTLNAKNINVLVNQQVDNVARVDDFLASLTSQFEQLAGESSEISDSVNNPEEKQNKIPTSKPVRKTPPRRK